MFRSGEYPPVHTTPINSTHVLTYQEVKQKVAPVRNLGVLLLVRDALGMKVEHMHVLAGRSVNGSMRLDQTREMVHQLQSGGCRELGA